MKDHKYGSQVLEQASWRRKTKLHRCDEMNVHVFLRRRVIWWLSRHNGQGVLVKLCRFRMTFC